MQLQIFSIYDVKAKVYCRPILVHSEGAMLRNFGDMANDVTDTIGKHPEDYILFKTGTWDDNTNKFEMDDKPQSFGLASAYVKMMENKE
jgi:hypothetical protein